MKLPIIILLVLCVINSSRPAKILGIIPTASYSHQIPFQPLWRELSKRGHQLTVMTTDPINDPTLTNLTEINMNYTYSIYKKYNFAEVASDESKSFLDIAKVLAQIFAEQFPAQLSSPEAQNLIHNKDVEFDLVMVEAQLPAMLGFPWRFKCPWIGLASLDAAMQFHEAAGNPTHPVVNPDNNLPVIDPENLNFKERLISLVFSTLYKFHVYYRYFPKEYLVMKRFFGEDLPTIWDLHNSMSMLFVSTNPIFHNVRPLNPNTITIGGGLHFQPAKPLPKNLQDFLDNAPQGVIYFSLGSNIKNKNVNQTMKNAILEAFSELPQYKILMKMDGLTEVPANVIVEKWVPQQDLLRHPNIKLFITQGGIQSLQEAVLNSVPLIGIPFFGDQLTNVQKMLKKGYGLKIDKKQLTKNGFKEAILEVINNPKYKEKAVEMSQVFLDEPLSSLDSAIWWTEYVIRNKGAPHLRSAVDIPTWKYYMLDVVLFLATIIVVTFYIIYRITKYICKKVFWKSPTKTKHA